MTTFSNNPTSPEGRGRIVVGIDGSLSSMAALTWAVTQCQLTGCALDLVSVYSPASELAYGFGQAGFSAMSLEELESAARELLAESRAKLPSELHVPIRLRTICDASASHALTRVAVDATLLVVGAHRRIGLGMLGSTAVACLKHATCPVVVVPAPAAVRVESEVGLEAEGEAHFARQRTRVAAETEARSAERVEAEPHV